MLTSINYHEVTYYESSRLALLKFFASHQVHSNVFIKFLDNMNSRQYWDETCPQLIAQTFVKQCSTSAATDVFKMEFKFADIANVRAVFELLPAPLRYTFAVACGALGAELVISLCLSSKLDPLDLSSSFLITPINIISPSLLENRVVFAKLWAVFLLEHTNFDANVYPSGWCFAPEDMFNVFMHTIACTNKLQNFKFLGEFYTAMNYWSAQEVMNACRALDQLVETSQPKAVHNVQYFYFNALISVMHTDSDQKWLLARIPQTIFVDKDQSDLFSLFTSSLNDKTVAQRMLSRATIFWELGVGVNMTRQVLISTADAHFGLDDNWWYLFCGENFGLQESDYIEICETLTKHGLVDSKFAARVVESAYLHPHVLRAVLPYLVPVMTARLWAQVVAGSTVDVEVLMHAPVTVLHKYMSADAKVLWLSQLPQFVLTEVGDVGFGLFMELYDTHTSTAADLLTTVKSALQS